MYKQFEELAVGTTFYQKRSHAGVVQFEITSFDGDTFKVASVQPKGFDHVLTETLFKQLQDVEYHFFETLGEAEAFELQKEANDRAEYIDIYKEDKAGFTEAMIQLAYNKEIYGKYGNPGVAQAIQQLAKIHYPDFTIE